MATNRIPITRYASKSFNFGPLAYLEDDWTGDTGFNLMVVPRKTPDGKTSFLVMVQQLFEIQNFTRVGAPVPNRGGNVGREQIMGVKYNQTVAENVSKNILHEEVGMWLWQTPSNIKDPSNPLKVGWSTINNGDFQKPLHPVSRQGVIPHGNSILLSGDWESESNVPNFPPVNESYLPVITTPGIDPAIQKKFQAFYLSQIENALSLLPSGETSGLTVDNFVHPTSLLIPRSSTESSIGTESLKFFEVINIHVNSENSKGFGGVDSIPFAHSFALPVDFESYHSIQVVDNTAFSKDPGHDTADTQDEVMDYLQLQYFQNIKIQFNIDFEGVNFTVVFPHFEVNTLVKI